MKITNIEQVKHFVEKKRKLEFYVVQYASGRNFQYWCYEHLPKTVRAFLKCHYDEYQNFEDYEVYNYKAINIIK